MIDLLAKLYSKSLGTYARQILMWITMALWSVIIFLIILYLIPMSWFTSPPEWLVFPFLVIFSLIVFASVGGFYAIGLIKPKKKTRKPPSMKA